MIFGLVVLEFYMQTLLYANLEIQKIIVHAFYLLNQRAHLHFDRVIHLGIGRQCVYRDV